MAPEDIYGRRDEFALKVCAMKIFLSKKDNREQRRDAKADDGPQCPAVVAFSLTVLTIVGMIPGTCGEIPPLYITPVPGPSIAGPVMPGHCVARLPSQAFHCLASYGMDRSKGPLLLLIISPM